VILVCRFWYMKVCLFKKSKLHGLTPDSVWMIEGGKIACRVKSIRFNQSIIQMLAPDNAEMIGDAEPVGIPKTAATVGGCITAGSPCFGRRSSQRSVDHFESLASWTESFLAKRVKRSFGSVDQFMQISRFPVHI
jgi:hypothetical protein